MCDADTPTSALWRCAYAAVFPGALLNAARQQLTKLANERFDGEAWLPVTEDKWEIRWEAWPWERVTVSERKHADAGPRRVEGPLVVVQFRGRELLVDGTHRVNTWLAGEHPAVLDVLIVSHPLHP